MTWTLEWDLKWCSCAGLARRLQSVVLLRATCAATSTTIWDAYRLDMAELRDVSDMGDID